MKFPWSKTDSSTTTDSSKSATQQVSGSINDATTPNKGTAFTPGKGRPTPKRNEAQGKKRGPVAPAPLTRAEAKARRKELGVTKQTKEERRAASAERRERMQTQRALMMDGDERYLLPRDKGEVRRYARDIVDSRRNFSGLFMPFAVVLIMFMILPPQIAVYSTLLMLLFVVFMVIDSIILGRIVNNRVRERFPTSTDGGFKLGVYAFMRALQIRKLRTPKPNVKAGEAV